MKHPAEYGLTSFYFALPKRASLPAAIAHIDDRFGVTGEAEHVRSEFAFDLYRIKG